jgi:hypothetical protein
MIVLRCIRPDKVLLGCQNYIIEHLDPRFIEPPPFDLGPCAPLYIIAGILHTKQTGRRI